MKPKKLKKEEKIFYSVLGIVGGLFVLFLLAHLFTVFNRTDDIFKAINGAFTHMISAPFDIFPLPLGELAVSTVFIALALLAYFVKEGRRKKMLPGKEEGSAEWNTKIDQYNKQYTSPKGKPVNTGADNMIFTDDIFMSMNTRQTMRNNNVLVIGGSGAGKSRFFVKPNLLQENCSYVITDPSGELLESCAGFLEKEGYKIKIFNLVEMQYSNHYNPFNYIRDDEGVLMMINCLIQNTTPQGASKGDPFWEKSETALLLAICFYLQYEIRPEDRNFTNVMRLLLTAEVKEDQEDYKSTLDLLFEELEERNPNHIAVRYYHIFKMGAGKTLKSILISCTVRLAIFNLKKVQDLTAIDDIDLKTLGDEKQALFVVIPSADSTFNCLVSMMYSQLFETLYFHAENDAAVCKGKRLPVHVRFMLDEFANIGTIPDFEKKLATMRKYEISCSIILQNLAQLKTMYKDAWESITGNCDSFLFLGGQEQTTLEYVSKKLGKVTILTRGSSTSKGRQGSYSENFNNKGRDLMSPDEISRMDNKNCILFIRGLLPFFSNKYNYPRHPNYKLTGDADDKLLYQFRDPKRFEIKKKEKKRSSKVRSVKPRPIREKTNGDVKTMQVQDVDMSTISALGAKENTIEEVSKVVRLMPEFRADHEFADSEEFTSNFLSENVTSDLITDENVVEIEEENDDYEIPEIEIEGPEEPEEPNMPESYFGFTEDDY